MIKIYIKISFTEIDDGEKKCQCDGCKKKKIILQKSDPWKKSKALMRFHFNINYEIQCF